MGAPRLLHVAGGLERLAELLDGPTVAIVGTRAASDYGMEVAHGLGHGLAASGVTVVGGFAEGIAAAAHAGALEVGGPTVTVAAGGVDVCHPASRRALYGRLCGAGCALAELPCGLRPRSWCHTARARIVVALAQLVVVVEAEERPRELLHARLARDAGTTVAAVPGRVTSPASRGTHVLLRDGAVLVRDPHDVLDALYGVDAGSATTRHTAATLNRRVLPPPLRTLLDEVGAGRDTVAKLLAAGACEPETLVGLAKLECSGALVRGDAGRYVPRL
jgi:DNA processing protein